MDFRRDNRFDPIWIERDGSAGLLG